MFNTFQTNSNQIIINFLNSSSDEDDLEDESTKSYAGMEISFKDESNNSSVQSRPFTKDEIAVLRRGSSINSRSFVPFFPHIDSKEKFFLPIPFSDKACT